MCVREPLRIANKQVRLLAYHLASLTTSTWAGVPFNNVNKQERGPPAGAHVRRIIINLHFVARPGAVDGASRGRHRVPFRYLGASTYAYAGYR